MTDIVTDPIVALPPQMLDATRPPALDEATGTWMVWGYDDVTHVLIADAKTISREFIPDPSAHPAYGFMWAADPPRHAILRTPAREQFRAPTLAADFGPFIRATADHLITEEAREGRLDLARWSLRLANRVACALLGIDADLEEARVERLLREAGDAETQPQAPNGPEISDWIRGMIASRREWRGPGLLGHLLELQAAGYPLTDEDIISYVWGMLAAGTVTTGAQLTSAVLHLATRDLLGLLRNPVSRRLVMEETFRFDPAFPMTRALARDGLLLPSGVVIPAGNLVTVCLSSANRDPRVFERPHEFVPDRLDNPHRTFGAGIHHCMGQHLARLEADIALPMLADRLPGLTIEPPAVRHLGIVHRYASAEMIYATPL